MLCTELLLACLWCRDADFHFWDATDDIMDASLDLLFERTRLYLHNTKGRFGSVPMSLTGKVRSDRVLHARSSSPLLLVHTGDLDLNPLTGSYRLTATVPGVEANQLRATLGVRPTPFPVAGAVAGTLHVTGPLEKPIFSGTAMVRGVPACRAIAFPAQRDHVATLSARVTHHGRTGGASQ